MNIKKKKSISEKSNSSTDRSITNDSDEDCEENDQEEEVLEDKPKDKYLTGKCLLQFKK